MISTLILFLKVDIFSEQTNFLYRESFSLSPNNIYQSLYYIYNLWVLYSCSKMTDLELTVKLAQVLLLC